MWGLRDMWYVYTVVLLLLLPCYVGNHELALNRTVWRQIAPGWN